MVATKWIQLKALTYKEYLVKKRNLLTSCLVEFLIPIFIGYLLLVHIPKQTEDSLKKKSVQNKSNEAADMKVAMSLSHSSSLAVNDVFAENKAKIIEGFRLKRSKLLSLVFLVFLKRPVTVLFYPRTPQTTELMAKFQIMSLNLIEIIPANSKEEFDVKMNKSVKEVSVRKCIAGIIFHNSSTRSYWLNYEIRPTLFHFNDELYIHKTSRFSGFRYPYFESGFVLIQTFINEAYLRIINKTNSLYNLTAVNEQPDIDVFGETQLLNTVLIFNTVFITTFLPLSVLVKRTFDEKNNNTKQYQKHMSMRELEYWLAKVIVHSFIFMFHSMYIVCLLFYNTKGTFQWSLLLVVLMIYMLSQLLFAIMITLFINNSMAGITAYIVIQLLFCFPLFKVLKKPGKEEILGKVFFGQTDYSEVFHLLLPLMTTPNYSLVMIIQFFLEGNANANEAKYIPTQVYYTFKWPNIFTVFPGYNILCIFNLTAMMIVASLLYICVIWLFSDSRTTLDSTSQMVENKVLKQNKENKRMKLSGLFEADPISQTVGVEITNVIKRFKNKNAVVKDVSLKLYFGQITVLLGHNGAGKTTLMSMISGMIQPTSGTIFIQGFDVVKNREKALENVGLCPQNNILFEDFTVDENLYIFGLLKGFPENKISYEITNVLKLINLTDKRYVKVRTLSGGMKRKLQLGIACVGGRKILILDEPSSGLDIEARRVIWDFLQSIRKNFMIFMTTHHMEEADCLADRIIIMSEGEIYCSGSSQFLKRVFNVGYHLRILTQESNKKPIRDFVQKRLKNVNIENETLNEVVFNFPAEQSLKLSHFFNDLEQKQKEFGIMSFGVNIMSLEDVFLRTIAAVKGDSNSLTKVGEKFTLAKSSEALKSTVFKAILRKRFQTERRRWKTFCIFIVMTAFGSWLSFFLFSFGISAVVSTVPEWRKELNFTSCGYTDLIGFCQSDTSSFCPSLQNVSEKFGIKLAIINSDPANYMKNEMIQHYGNYREKFALGVQHANKSVALWFSHHVKHSLPIGINILFNHLLQEITNDSDSSISATIRTPEAEIKGIAKGRIFRLTREISFVPHLYAFSVLLPLCFPALIVTSERVSRAKLLQFMTGVSPLIYWISNFLFDIIYAIIIAIPFWITLFSNAKYVFFSPTLTYALLISYVSLMVSFISVNYLLSFVFSKPSSSFIFLLVFSVLTGTILNEIQLITKMFGGDEPRSLLSSLFFGTMDVVARISPFWLFVQVFVKVMRTTNSIDLCKSFNNATVEAICQRPLLITKVCCEKCGDECFNEKYNPFEFEEPGALSNILLMISICVASTFIIFVIESRFISHETWVKLPPKEEEDSDVLKEREKVDKMITERGKEVEGFVCHRLSKIYRGIQPLKDLCKHPTTLLTKFLAVNQVSFVIGKDEIFGFLGANGAGKTTTFRMLVGDLISTCGNAFVMSFSLHTTFRQYQRQIGYCPQFDALFDHLSGSETLQFFSTVRGIPEMQINNVVNNVVRLVDLENHATNIATFYSGGNKRKLSLAIAMIGCPAILLLDEPTSGVDPSARRKLWKAIETYKAVQKGSVILSSHSMNECESLCNRIGIMAKGNLVALGSIQHLKSKFCQGFTIFIKLKTQTPFEEMNEFIKKQLKNCKLSDDHRPLIAYNILDPQSKISSLFEVMEKTKTIYDFEEYHITQTSLEQIFLSVSTASSRRT